MITVELTDEQAEALVELLDEQETLPEVLDLLLDAIPYEPEPREIVQPDVDLTVRPLRGGASAGYTGGYGGTTRTIPARSNHGFGKAMDIAVPLYTGKIAKEMSFNYNYGTHGNKVLMHEEPLTMDQILSIKNRFSSSPPSTQSIPSV